MALQAIQAGAIGAVAYHTWTKEDPPLYTSECAWAEPITPSSEFETRWTRAEKIQAVIHNDRYACHCLNLQSACPLDSG